ncbi:MAG: hypothetical protein ACN6O3_06340 [Comamonas sp.]
MKKSKIQLMELNLIKSYVEHNALFTQPPNEINEVEINLQTGRSIEVMPDFWNKYEKIDSAIKERTYMVRLAVRTPKREPHPLPYNFEAIFTGIVVVFDIDKNDNRSPGDYALVYGLTLLYGAIRDHVLSLTQKMDRGPLLVPTMSFMDESFDAISASTEALKTRTKEQLANQT